MLVVQSCLPPWNLTDYTSPGSSLHGILEARFSRESSQPRDWTWVSCFAGWFFTESPGKPRILVNLAFKWSLRQSTIGKAPFSRVFNCQDLMPDDLRWSRCNNNRNKVHNKCNVLESPLNQFVEKLSSTKPVPSAKKVGSH